MIFPSFRPYLWAGVAIAFLGVGGVAAWYKIQATAAETEVVRQKGRAAAAEALRDQFKAALDQAVSVNQENQETIDKMVAEGLRRDHIIVGMADEIAGINAELQERTEAYNALKDADVTVKDFLSLPIPDALRKLRIDPKASPAAGDRQN